MYKIIYGRESLFIIYMYTKEYDKIVDILYRKRCLYVLGIKISRNSFCVKTIIYASYSV